jgi:hypothetical protein
MLLHGARNSWLSDHRCSIAQHLSGRQAKEIILATGTAMCARTNTRAPKHLPYLTDIDKNSADEPAEQVLWILTGC